MCKMRWMIGVIVVIVCHNVFAGEDDKGEGMPQRVRRLSARPFPVKNKDNDGAPRKKRRASRTLSVSSTDLDPLPIGQGPILLSQKVPSNEVYTMEEESSASSFVPGDSAVMDVQECLPYGYGASDSHTVAANGDFAFIPNAPRQRSESARPWLNECAQGPLPGFSNQVNHRATVSPSPHRATPIPRTFETEDV